MKRVFCAFLCLTLLLAAVPALAAPARERQAMEITLDDRLQSLMEIAAQAYLGPRWESILDGRQPDVESGAAVQDRPWRAVAYAMARENKSELTADEAAQMAAQIYTGSQWTPQGEGNGLVSFSEGVLRLDPDGMQGDFALGVYPYSASFDGNEARVKADLYCTPSDYTGKAEDLPEDMVIWILGMEFDLDSAPELPYGYTVNACRVTPLYRDGDLTAWQEVENTEYEYSLNMPCSLGLENEDAAHWAWQTADGTARLRVDAGDPMSYDEALNAFMQANPGRQADGQRDYDYFSSAAPGELVLVVASENASWSYTLTLSFPEERQGEYELYFEFIRNSFGVWGLSNG